MSYLSKICTEPVYWRADSDKSSGCKDGGMEVWTYPIS